MRIANKSRMAKAPSILIAVGLLCPMSTIEAQTAQQAGLSVVGAGIVGSLESPTANVSVFGDYAYVGGLSRAYTNGKNIGIRIVDLRDPTRPTLVARIPLRSEGFHESHSHGDAVVTHVSSAAFEGDVAIVLDGVPDRFTPEDYPQPYGLWDVSDPAKPVFLSILSFGKGVFANENGDGGDRPYDSKAAVGNYFYALFDAIPRGHSRDKTNESTMLGIVDISDPRNPEILGTWQDAPKVWLFGLSINEKGTRAYITGLFGGTYHFESTDGYLYVVDVQDPHNPKEIGRYHFDLRGVPSSPWIARATADDKVVALTDGSWGQRSNLSVPLRGCGILHFLDTSDPASITELSTVSNALSDSPGCWDAMAVDVAIRGNTVFSTWLEQGVRAFDISDPSNPVAVGQPKIGGLTISDVALLGDDMLVATRMWNAGLYVLSYDPPPRATASEDDSEAPGVAFAISSYPNPIRDLTTIELVLNKRATVRMSVLDIFGRTVEELVEGPRSAGKHRVVWDSADRPSGIYFLRLETVNGTTTRSMMVSR